MNYKSVLVLAVFALLGAVLSAQEATIARLAGAESVTVTLPDGHSQGGQDVEMGQGEVIPVGSWVIVPDGAKLFLRTFTGTVSVFSAGSIFEVTQVEANAGQEITRLTLQNGDMVANLDPKKRNVNDYGVVTPKGVAAARGTNYTVSVNGQEVLVTVVAGVVTVDIPDVGTVNLNTGQVTTGGAPTTLAAALGDSATAAITRTALQNAASVVATLATTGVDGVTNDTLSTVVSTAAEAASEAGDNNLVADVATAATQANPAAVETIVTAAVSAAPAAASEVVESVAQEVVESTGADTATTTSALAEIARDAGSSVTIDESAITDSVDQNIEDSEGPEPEVDVEVDVPLDEVDVIREAVFTIRLSGGRLVAVTLNNSDAQVTTTLVTTAEGPVTEEIGDGGQVAFTIPARVAIALGEPVTAQQFQAIADALEILLGIPEITVPNNTIVVSPSS